MELPELKQGLQDIQQQAMPPVGAPDSVPNGVPAGVPAPWLTMDNMMGAYGNWFDNDQGIGEVLLQQLRMRGVDTQAATEAMLRELLKGLVDDMNMLQMRLAGFMAELEKQTQQTSAIAGAVDTALASSGAPPMAQEILPPEQPFNDVPPEMAAAQGNPESMGGPRPMDMQQQEMPAQGTPEGEQPPVPPVEANQAQTEMPPMLRTEPQPTGNVPSDKRLKFVVSDKMLKDIKNKFGNIKLNNNIINACKGGF